jgi:phage tail sheath protein FI
MAEDFSISELVIPGTYVRVRAEGLIGVGGISTGNIGIVGSATTVPTTTITLSDYESAKATFGMYTAFSTPTANLTRALEILFRNGARTVYARAVASADRNATAAYTTAFNELLKEDVNILVAPELSTANALTVLPPLLETAENSGKDLMAVIGSDATTVANIIAQVVANKRLIMTAPGLIMEDSAGTPTADGGLPLVSLPGNYGAAAVAGLISTLTPQSSPTNKVLPGVTQLSQRFSYGETRDLLNGNVCVLEQRQGTRVVRGLTTEGAAFKQITTRRITDFAKQGIRMASQPFIGRLNNQRVRKALYSAIDGFLTTMLQDEALTGYKLQVTATRQDEINGRAIVNATIQPTFSIDFVVVTLVLE